MHTGLRSRLRRGLQPVGLSPENVPTFETCCSQTLRHDASCAGKGPAPGRSPPSRPTCCPDGCSPGQQAHREAHAGAARSTEARLSHTHSSASMGDAKHASRRCGAEGGQSKALLELFTALRMPMHNAHTVAALKVTPRAAIAGDTAQTLPARYDAACPAWWCHSRQGFCSPPLTQATLEGPLACRPSRQRDASALHRSYAPPSIGRVPFLQACSMRTHTISPSPTRSLARSPLTGMPHHTLVTCGSRRASRMQRHVCVVPTPLRPLRPAWGSPGIPPCPGCRRCCGRTR